jgi:hypothetical protein
MRGQLRVCLCALYKAKEAAINARTASVRRSSLTYAELEDLTSNSRDPQVFVRLTESAYTIANFGGTRLTGECAGWEVDTPHSPSKHRI